MWWQFAGCKRCVVWALALVSVDTATTIEQGIGRQPQTAWVHGKQRADVHVEAELGRDRGQLFAYVRQPATALTLSLRGVDGLALLEPRQPVQLGAVSGTQAFSQAFSVPIRYETPGQPCQLVVTAVLERGATQRVMVASFALGGTDESPRQQALRDAGARVLGGRWVRVMPAR